ncbi:carbon-nitrogen hydrolase family protein [Granulosicoccus antarcticus]|uniref:(R)-stereoselective amidase n=1 Tax=Granulosicoccus antarcticus IMCC3135 TaxID=1192854 RepID=A0A2Z2NVG6_9GAMM|nr:carbon-nitrogen hydrolase family protein [Granulosicoccus antarcticus]ASJ75233.1 (R)-stereoselective amidase [Granulosicoccus antarcticus IMCC3135]
MNAIPDFTLAVHQHVPTPADVDTSIARIQQISEQAAASGADLLLVPEASLTGYNLPLDTARTVAVERDSKTTARLQAICQQHGIALSYGYIERDGEHLFNSVNVIDSSGSNIAHYRKTHLWGGLDRSLFQAGTEYAPTFKLNGWNLGLLICYDIEFPESARHLALQGVDIILAPTALMTPWTFVADLVTRVRAAENQVYFAYANYCGPEADLDYVGRSCIIGPDAQELARADCTPQLLLATLNKQAIDNVRRELPYHADRRPELYGSLA